MTIGIRTDANSIIATGHMMRCMTIAETLVMQGQAVTFFVADEESQKLYRDFAVEGTDIVVLHTDYKDMEGELDILLPELEKRDIQTLLVDSYSVTRKYFEELGKSCKVAYLDDLKADIYPVDALINYSGYSVNMEYDKAYSSVHGFNNEATRLFLGLMYAPLRRQFYASEFLDKKTDGIDVLLSTGGADMCNMIIPVLEGVISKSLNVDMTFHVVIGDFVTNKEEIEKISASAANIELHYSVKDMATLMRSCDVAILAAGTMLTESAACHLPVVFYQVADNQKYNVEYFGSSEGMVFAGNVMGGGDEKARTIDRILDEVKRIASDAGSRKLMERALLDMTDGRGAIRIAEEIVKL